MKRQDLITQAQTLNIDTLHGKPLEQCHTIEIERAVKALMPQALTGPSIKSQIIDLARQGLTKKAIEQKLLDQGVTRIRYQYIMVVLKNENIEVPSAKTGRKEVIEVVSEVIPVVTPEVEITVTPKASKKK